MSGLCRRLGVAQVNQMPPLTPEAAKRGGREQDGCYNGNRAAELGQWYERGAYLSSVNSPMPGWAWRVKGLAQVNDKEGTKT